MNPNRGNLPAAAMAMLAIAASLPVAASAQDKKAPAQSVATVEAPVSMCVGCHSIPGYQASFPQVFRVPKIGGQSKEYIEAALRAYQKGERNQPTMKAIARDLTDQQIAALGAYYAARGN